MSGIGIGIVIVIATGRDSLAGVRPGDIVPMDSQVGMAISEACSLCPLRFSRWGGGGGGEGGAGVECRDTYSWGRGVCWGGGGKGGGKGDERILA